MDRRTFLAGTGWAVAAGLSGCTSDVGPAGCGGGDDPGPPPDWASVRSRLSGRLVLPGEAGYAQAAQPYNTLFDSRRPAAVAQCAHPQDIQVCLDAGRSAALPIAARSGGHSYAAYSTPDGGLVIDLGPTAGVTVGSGGIAEVGAGTRLVDVYTSLARAGRCLPGGTCASLGIAGLALGGGLGVLSRKFGLTCDQLVAARVVAPDGQVVLASPETEPELFWALRGGGGGNFGIVTTLWLRTEPLLPLALFELHFPSGSAPEVLGAWQEWMPVAPAELWARVVLAGGSPPNCAMQGCFIGQATTASSHITGFLRRARVKPESDAVWDTGFLDGMRYFATSANDTGTGNPGQTFIASSRVQQHPADPAALVALLDGRDKLTVQLEPLGGAINRVPVQATAFPHRNALATAQVYAVPGSDHAETAGEVATVQRALATTIGSGAYINYIDPAQADWATACYGPNLPRLKAIARHWDPDGVLAFSQGLSGCL